MNKKSLFIFIFIAIAAFFNSCDNNQNKYETKTATDKDGRTYEYVTNDPTETRIYTLKNGLKVFLSTNQDAPRIQTFIAVKTGSKRDPKETTGLAHYLEHMMFKGTNEIGTKDWGKEQPIIQQISDLFEKHRQATNPDEKKKIYAQIDSVSQLASQLTVPNEYDKLMSSIGAKGTNAWTWHEETVYVNDIPSNEIERWLMIESERFSGVVLRLFHTELETVFEEFNMSQDNDNRKTEYAKNAALFKNHPYGTQTTLGKGEHLKNPSMVNIMNYFHTFYVPNNMAICMAGDLDFENTMALIEKYWNNFETKPVPDFEIPKEDPITQHIEKTVYGPETDFIEMAFRVGGNNSEDKKYVTLINSILYNGTAGLIDLNLVQQQKVLSAYSYPEIYNDYGMHAFSATPRKGQRLEEVKDLILQQIEKVKKGEFDDWMLTAAIKNFKLQRIRSMEGNYRANSYVSVFIDNSNWRDYVAYIDELEKITKKDIVDFANKTYKENYVVVYKRMGKDTTVMKVDKPAITQLNINRDTTSVFFQKIKSIKTPEIEPVFIDFDKEISHNQIGNSVDLSYIKNQNNDLFNLFYVLDMGQNHNPKLDLAVRYLEFIGTEKYTPEQFKQVLYKNALSLNVWCGDNRSYIMLSGMDESLGKAMELMNELINNAKPDEKAYKEYAEGILKEREDAKTDKNTILWEALYNYAQYGAKSPFTNIVSEEELKNLNPKELTDLVKSFLNYKHDVFYYGPEKIEQVADSVNKYNKNNDNLAACPPEIQYPELPTDKPKVYFVNYDMVQANMVMLSKRQPLDISIYPQIQLFNEYFDGDMSSLVFQEIREAKALAYSSSAGYTVPYEKGKSHYIYTYIATQSDKIKLASDAMNSLVNNMPKIEKNFIEAKENIRKRIQTERIRKTNIYWTWETNMDRGINYDIRKDIYDKVNTMTYDDFNRFYEENVKGQNFVYLIVSNKDKIKMDVLNQFGPVEEVKLEDIFGY